MAPRAKRTKASPIATPNVSPNKIEKSSPKKRASSRKKLFQRPRPTTVGQVFVVGNGGGGQLGLGADVLEKVRPTPLKVLNDENIVDISVGGMHTIALTKDGKLWSWGCNDEGVLGRDTSVDESELEPSKVEGLDGVEIISVCCGDSISAALSKEGRVYAWGTFRGSSGLFGFAPGEERSIQKIPALIHELKNIVQIAAGTNHLLAMDEQGKIFSWGIGEQGQLGRKIMGRHAIDSALTPRQINFKPYRRSANFVGVYCGGYHSFLVHESNEVFSFGLNNHGQCGLGDTESHEIPDLVEGLPVDGKIKKIVGGEHFTVILKEDGRVYVCGRNDDGMLGLDQVKYPNHCTTAVQLNLPKISSISCGGVFSFAVTDTGDLYAWGYGTEGQLANGSAEDDPADAPVPFQVELKGRQVLCADGGGQHSVFLIKPKDD